jgi:hypothetical protein
VFLCNVASFALLSQIGICSLCLIISTSLMIVLTSGRTISNSGVGSVTGGAQPVFIETVRGE